MPLLPASTTSRERSQMPHPGENARGCGSGLDNEPTDARRLAAKHDIDHAIRGPSLTLATVDDKASRASAVERRRRSPDGLRASGPQPTSLSLTSLVAIEPTSKDGRSERGLAGDEDMRRNLDRPECPPDPLEIRLVGDALMPQELRPGTRRGVGEVLNGPLCLSMPARGWLVRRLPEKGEATVTMPEQDQVAPAPTSAAASPRTRRMSSSSGRKPRFSTAEGERPPSCERGRPNHRRMPNSL